MARHDPYERAEVVVLFRSQLREEAGPGYGEMAQVMLDRASGFPGFVAIRDYEGADGERLAVIWWENHETLAAWRDDLKHLAAQKAGREKWFAWFQLEICDRVRASQFERSP